MHAVGDAVGNVERSCTVEEELVRRLVGHVQRSGFTKSQQSIDSNRELVILDIDVDGSRYLLVRMPLVDRSPIQLSPREWEIARMVAQGKCNKIIADVLNISAWTVCTHLRRIFAKLGVNSRAAMIARLNEIGAKTL
jgi:DNA-binding NarL/FixJ family response regulator